MLITTATPEVTLETADTNRAMSRTLSVVLDAALSHRGDSPGPRRPVRFVAQLLDDRRDPVFASGGDLTPYVAELLAEEVRWAARTTRVDLFVGPESAATLRVLAHRQIERLHHHRLAIHVHD
jgi:hypothetical protein